MSSLARTPTDAHTGRAASGNGLAMAGGKTPDADERVKDQKDLMIVLGP
ncbi:hypothetical protein [Demequina sp. SO4-18]